MLEKILKYKAIYLFFLLAGCFLMINKTEAADPNLPIRDPGYSAKYIDQSILDPIEIPAGTSKTVVVRFKNTGSAVWRAGGSRFISAYTVEPKYHNSLFRGTNWIGSDQTASISGDVYPGQVGELKINLIAPNTTGSYVEKFYLAAENYSWVANSYFYIKINVTPAPKIVQEEIKPVEIKQVTETPLTAYKAKRFILNLSKVEAPGGSQIKLIVGYQNTGDSSWKKYAIVPGGSTLAGENQISFADETWTDQGVVLQKENQVLSGGIVRETFYIRAPSKTGLYTARFNLKVDDTVLGDGMIELPITVTSDAPDHYSGAEFSNLIFAPVFRLATEPRIKVGIWKDANVVEFISDEDNFNVYNGLGLMGVVPKGILVQMSYSNGVYTFSGAGMDFKTTNYIRLEPAVSPHSVFTLRNLERQVSWKGPINFNRYRGAAEYRVTQDGTSVYLINDVLLEDYVKSIGETTNLDSFEYIKALLTAARTYAYYTKEYSDKHNARYFDVVAHTGDQLYLGYLHETIAPRVVEAAIATRGAIITYLGNPVITPYFGNTDGRTRAWTEVWGGTTKPWLVSVKADYDLRDGKRLFGHGVGMSQRDANLRAKEGGASFSELIKYYYTGVEVETFYK